jgi:hypothetical protein
LGVDVSACAFIVLEKGCKVTSKARTSKIIKMPDPLTSAFFFESNIIVDISFCDEE